MSKLIKTDIAIAPANNFASKIEEAIAKIAPTRPLLTNCPACGSASMNDPQAQFVGACSASCAKQLGISEEVLKASGSVPPALLPSIVRRVEGYDDYSIMMEDAIYMEWTQRFGYSNGEEAERAVPAAIKRARFIAVKPTADIEVSECGCIWALQTTYALGSGDVILRNCDKHGPDGILKGF